MAISTVRLLRTERISLIVRLPYPVRISKIVRLSYMVRLSHISYMRIPQNKNLHHKEAISYSEAASDDKAIPNHEAASHSRNI